MRDLNLYLYDEHTDLAAFYTEWLGYNDRRENVPLKREITHNALTPYHAEKWTMPTVDKPGAPGRMNHTLYDLFALRTRLTPGVRRYWPSLSHRIVRVMMNDRIGMEVQLRDGAVNWPLSKDDQSKMQKLIDGATQWEQKACWILDGEVDIFHLGVRMESSWLKSVIPRIILPAQTCYAPGARRGLDCMGEYRPVLRGDSLYVVLDGGRDYLSGYNWLKLKITDLLYKYRIDGAILLDSKRDADFISKWELVPLECGTVEGDVRTLYTPRWKSMWLGTDFTSYLLQRYRCEYRRTTADNSRIAVPYSENYAMRDTLARELRSGGAVTFMRENVLLNVGSAGELQQYNELLSSQYLRPSVNVALLDTGYEIGNVGKVVRYTVLTEGEIASARVH